MIDSYVFGRMTVDGREYTSDLIILPGRILYPWWRAEGHRLILKDLEDVFAAPHQILIVGTGFMGAMRLDEEVRVHAEQAGIRLLVEKTRGAVKAFNRFTPDHKVCGAFHLTC